MGWTQNRNLVVTTAYLQRKGLPQVIVRLLPAGVEDPHVQQVDSSC